MMSDFEDRLSAVLVAEVEHAPTVTGLAAAARRRHVARRRRKIAAGATAVVLAVAVPTMALDLGGTGSDRTASDPAPSGWQTIEHRGTQLEIPADWGLNTCRGEPSTEVVQYSAAGGSCEEDAGFLSIYPAEEGETPGVVERFQWSDGPMVWGGYVEAGEWGLGMWHADRDVVLQVLASFRLEGQPQVVADHWYSSVFAGRRYRLPSGWGVEAGVGEGYLVDGMDAYYVGPERGQQLDASHYRRLDSSVIVTGPTRAVVDLVWASIKRLSADE